MSQSLTPTTSSVTTLEDRSWLASREGLETGRSITLDGASVRATFAAGTHLKSGVVLAKRTSDNKGVLYAGTSEERQTITVTGSPTGGTYTLTWSGQTTTAIAYNAAASVVQTALENLNNIAVGDVAVTGSAGGPYSVTFQGALANTDEPAMTATASLTGGSTPGVTIATPTAGGADLGSGGSGVAIGHLHSGETVPATGDLHVTYLHRCDVIEANLPVTSGPGALDPAAKADLTGVHYF